MGLTPYEAKTFQLIAVKPSHFYSWKTSSSYFDLMGLSNF